MTNNCHRCFEVGHKSNECPKRVGVRVNLIEDHETKFEENFANMDDVDQQV